MAAEVASGAFGTANGSSGPTAAPACRICEGALGAKPARGCCQTCWRKFRAAGIELPPPSKPGPRARDPLHSALDRLSPAVRLRALAYLTERATETAA
jgi:hypothetical protein